MPLDACVITLDTHLDPVKRYERSVANARPSEASLRREEAVTVAVRRGAEDVEAGVSGCAHHDGGQRVARRIVRRQSGERRYASL
jgi:hypothetical protein